MFKALLRAGRRRFVRNLAGQVRKQMQTWRVSRAVPGYTISRRAMYLAARKTTLHIDRWAFPVVTAYTTALLGGAVFAAMFVVYWLDAGMEWGVATVIGSLLLSLLFLWAVTSMLRSISARTSFYAMVLVASVEIYGSSQLLQGQNHPLWLAISLAGTVAGFALICLAGVILVVHSAQVSSRATYPIEEIIVDTAEVIHQAVKGWNTLAGRKTILRRLEYVAGVTGRDLPQAFRSGDELTDGWFRTEMLRAANSVRRWKKLVLLAQAGTEYQFIANVRDFVTAIAQCEFHYLPRVDVRVEPRRWRDAVYSFSATAVNVTLPFGLLLLFRHVEAFRLEKDGEQWLKIGAFAWAFIAVTTRLLPWSAPALATFKEVISLLRK